MKSVMTGEEAYVYSKAKWRRAVFATLIGNSLEWFDFVVYGFFSVFIAKNFFSDGNAWNALLLTTAIFGVGFLARPIGGIFLSSYADRFGRKTILSLNILLMAVGTGLIGLAPTYASIGIWAPLIIVFARLLQGFSAGGEMGSATAFLIEHAPPQQRGYYSSWIQATIGLSALLGSGIGVLLTTWLSTEALYSWGWRIPFLLGLLLGPVGWYFRSKLDEPLLFRIEHERARHNTPLRELLKRFPVQVLASTALVALWTVLWYVVLVYMSTYAIKILKLPESNGMLAGMVGSLMVIGFCPVFGMLSDRFGRRIFHLGAAFLTCVLAYPMLWYLHAQPGLTSLLIFQIVFGLLIACYEGPLLATFSEVFPTRVRCTGISLVYNVGVIIFGGFAASIITWLIKYTADPLAPAFYLIAAALLSLVGVFFLKGISHGPEASHSRIGTGINNSVAEA